MEKIRQHITFYGYVQGVGFRWKAKYTAQSLGISGWIRNLDDGSVEMEAEGSERDIADLITAMEEHSWGSVERVEWKLKDIQPISSSSSTPSKTIAGVQSIISILSISRSTATTILK